MIIKSNISFFISTTIWSRSNRVSSLKYVHFFECSNVPCQNFRPVRLQENGGAITCVLKRNVRRDRDRKHVKNGYFKYA